MRIAIISDTHMPRSARVLPARCQELLSQADLIIHAGDFSTLRVMRELELHGELAAVHGNVDEARLRALLPRARTIEAGGIWLGLIHDAGPARGRLERMRRSFPDTDAVIFGHSHIPLHEVAPDGFQIFNPGSPTERRRAPRCTMGIARIEDGSVAFELVALD